MCCFFSSVFRDGACFDLALGLLVYGFEFLGADDEFDFVADDGCGVCRCCRVGCFCGEAVDEVFCEVNCGTSAEFCCALVGLVDACLSCDGVVDGVVETAGEESGCTEC